MQTARNLVLREKDRLVLNAVVENYLKLGQPISSGLLSHRRVIDDSAATIRNIMVKLTGLGYLAQPHTSAGRVPTDLGLKFYVNSLLDEMIFAGGPAGFDSPDFHLRRGDLGTFLNRVSSLLAEQSDNLGFVISPRISQIHFHHVRLVKISEERVMIILMTTFNLVLTEILDTHHYLSQMELDRASQYINQRFRGQNLRLVRDVLVRDLPTYRLSYENEIEKLTAMLREYIVREESEGQLFLQGAARLLDKPELFDMEKLRSLFQNFEEKVKLTKLLSDFISLDRVKVLIGAETNLPDASDCALVLSHYGYNNQVLGTLGIIGPKRIPYRRIIPLVDQVAKRLSQTISEAF